MRWVHAQIGPMVRAFAAVSLVLASLSVVGAQDAAADRRAVRIERSLMSPFCPGKTLHGCPSPRAGEWRADIRRWIGEGVSDAAIFERLQSRVPDFDLTGRPAGTADWAIPTGAAAFATFVLIAVARRWRPRGEEDSPETTSDEYDDRLDEELARLEG